jgi:L-asparaginase / beta-aspartyl-peptidase
MELNMIIVASANGLISIRQAMDVLKAGGSSLDAVEVGIRAVEDDLNDHSVGTGGYPNILGEVELDASLMEGRWLMAGAIGSIKGYRHPISIARQVMEKLPHVFLVGEGAQRFAAEFNFEKIDLLTPEAKKTYHIWLKRHLPPEVAADISNSPHLSRWVRYLSDPERSKGTVNFIALDQKGDMACGVSTSGWFVKYPGRLGDSPVIGAGNYADNRYGSAACTGMGEMAIRAGTARSVILYMKMGMSLHEAGLQAMNDLNDLGGNYLSDMNIIAIDRSGNPAGFTNTEGATFTYMTEEMVEPAVNPRVFVPTNKRWEEDHSY